MAPIVISQAEFDRLYPWQAGKYPAPGEVVGGQYVVDAGTADAGAAGFAPPQPPPTTPPVAPPDTSVSDLEKRLSELTPGAVLKRGLGDAASAAWEFGRSIADPMYRQRQSVEQLVKEIKNPQERPAVVPGEIPPHSPEMAGKIAYVQQQIAGAGGADPGPEPAMKTSLGSTTRQSAPLSTVEGVTARGKLEIAREGVQDVLTQRRKAASAEEKVQMDLAAAAEPLLKEYGDRVPQLRKMHDQMQQSLQQSRQRIEQMQIDPQRHMRAMPTTNKVLMGFAAMFGGFTGNKMPMELLERAIDRDIAAQRSNIQKAIQSHNLTKAQANALWNQYTHFEQQRRLVTNDIARFKIGAAAAASKKVDALAIAHQAYRELDARDVELAKAMTPRVTRSSQTIIDPRWKAWQAASAAGKKGGQRLLNRVLDKDLRKEVNDLQIGQSRAVRLMKLVENAGDLPLKGRGLPNSPSTTIDKELKWLALMLRRSFGDSGPVVVSDFANYGVPGIEGPLGRAISKDTLKQKLTEVYQAMRERRINSIYNAFRTQESFLQEGIDAAMEPAMPSGSTPPGGKAQ